MERPSFDQWLQMLAAQLVKSGYLSVEEAVSWTATGRAAPDYPPATQDKITARVTNPASFAVEIAASPKFAGGDQVRTRRFDHSGLTRLPGYARAREGTVPAHHGAHVFADDSAAGENLYIVAFQSAELWPEAQDRRDEVFIACWESYLERP
ncbi:MAG: nitrile hydratase subunit beta [Alphaproteobacteria bacterium]|nr:nitrile hydratase subunit beta [Alphaproteobacteria bacterium]